MRAWTRWSAASSRQVAVIVRDGGEKYPSLSITCWSTSTHGTNEEYPCKLHLRRWRTCISAFDLVWTALAKYFWLHLYLSGEFSSQGIRDLHSHVEWCWALVWIGICSLLPLEISLLTDRQRSIVTSTEHHRHISFQTLYLYPNKNEDYWGRCVSISSIRSQVWRGERCSSTIFRLHGPARRTHALLQSHPFHNLAGYARCFNANVYVVSHQKCTILYKHTILYERITDNLSPY